MKTLIAPLLPPLETRNWRLTALKDIQLNTAKSRWQELSAGLTTFVTMAYAVIVNPLILSHAGMPMHSVFFATCVTTACACFAMGFWARLPIAIAPSMAINGYFVAHLVPFYHGQWHQALTCCTAQWHLTCNDRVAEMATPYHSRIAQPHHPCNHEWYWPIDCHSCLTGLWHFSRNPLTLPTP